MKENNKSKFAILGALSINSGSGYDIKKFSDFSVSHFWNENYAHIYPVLKELEENGLVSSTEGKNVGRPAKTIYSITQEGKNELADWLTKPVEHAPVRNELLLKIFYSYDMPKESIIRILEDQKRQQLTKIEEYIAAEEMLTGNEHLRTQRGFPLWLSTIRYGVMHSKSCIQWCEDTIKAVETMPNTTEEE